MTPTRRTLLAASASAAIYAQSAKPDIFQAVAAGDVKLATELLDANPELARARSSDGRTPLHYATPTGNLEMVTRLATRGAELSAGPESPLLAAIDLPDHEAASGIAHFLLMNASDPNARTRDGRSALEIARAQGYGDIAKMLIHRGARTADPGKIAIAWYGRRYIQDIHGRPVNRDDLNGLAWTLVNQFASVAHADFDKAKQLLKDHPALLNTRASWDEGAVEAGAHMGRLDITSFLADAGATVSTCTAAVLGEEKMVREALAADRRSVRERGAHDLPILAYTAFAKEQPAIADALLGAGADVHARAFNQTVLHLAAAKGYVELATLFLDHGADVNATVKTRNGLVTPLDLAVKAQQTKMAQLLREHSN